jgi:hypothetical protein
MAAQTGRPSSFLPSGAFVDIAVVALVVVAVASLAMAWKARARRRTASLKISGGRKSLMQNLFGRV